MQFLIEGKMFYAHKIMLVNASPRLHNMLSSRFCEGTQNCIELSDVRYHIFEVGCRGVDVEDPCACALSCRTLRPNPAALYPAAPALLFVL